MQSLGEFESSNYISGVHGEYDITKGHFLCYDPYEDGSENPTDELEKVIVRLDDAFHTGFPFVMGGIRAVLVQINLYDV